MPFSPLSWLDDIDDDNRSVLDDLNAERDKLLKPLDLLSILLLFEPFPPDDYSLPLTKKQLDDLLGLKLSDEEYSTHFHADPRSINYNHLYKYFLTSATATEIIKNQNAKNIVKIIGQFNLLEQTTKQSQNDFKKATIVSIMKHYSIFDTRFLKTNYNEMGKLTKAEIQGLDKHFSNKNHLAEDKISGLSKDEIMQNAMKP